MKTPVLSGGGLSNLFILPFRRSSSAWLLLAFAAANESVAANETQVCRGVAGGHMTMSGKSRKALVGR